MKKETKKEAVKKVSLADLEQALGGKSSESDATFTGRSVCEIGNRVICEDC